MSHTDIAVTFADLEWQEQALCAQSDPDTWFPERGGSTRAAKQTCFRCDIRDRCLQYALDTDQRYGVWGGKSEHERARMRRQTEADAPIEAPEPTWRGHPEHVIRGWNDRHDAGESYNQIAATLGVTGETVARAVRLWAAGPGTADSEPKRPNRELTPSQQRILELRNQGMRNCDIARKLGMNRKTVNTSVGNLIRRGLLTAKGEAA
jgi:WhiB family redox-sensing transcriptional regulator